MKFNRAQNAARNIFFGVILKIYQIIIPFVMRTIMIYYMGMEYLGLNSLFTSVLSVLNLAELGVGGAMVYSMYRPIVEDDRDRIRSLMRLYRTYYRIIGLVIAVVGIILTPFIPKLIHGSVPVGMNVYILYLMNLAATVLTYWLFAYKNCILDAYQRTDIVSKITLLTNTVMYALQAWTVMSLHNYYAYVMMLLLGQILNNCLVALSANRMYPDLKPGKKLDSKSVKVINQRIRDLFTSKFSGMIVSSSDTLVISAFLGLTVLAEYQNYYYILSSVMGVIEIVFASVTAGIGNSLVAEPEEKNLRDFTKLTFIVSWVSAFASNCFLNLYQPFMQLWVGNKHTLDYGVVICLVVFFYISEVNRVFNVYKDAGGIWHKDRYRTLVTAIANLGMNLIMVQFWGVYGVVLSTVLSWMLIGIPWVFYNLFTTMFQRKHFKGYFKKFILYVVTTIIGCIVTTLICSFVNIGLIPTIIIRLVICILIPNLINIVVFRNQDEWVETLDLVNNMTGYRFSGIIDKILSRKSS